MTRAEDLVCEDGTVVLTVPLSSARQLERVLAAGLLVVSRADGGRPTPEAARILRELHNAAHGGRRFAPEPVIVTPGTVDPRVRTLFGAAQAAQVLGCTAKHVRYLCRAGHLRAQRVGTAWLITPEDLHAFRIERREGTNGKPGPAPHQRAADGG